MAYAAHALVAVGGRLNTNAPGAEIWQCGVRVQALGGGFLPDPEGYLTEAAITICDTLAGDNRMPNGVKIDYVKCNNIAPDGTYVDPVTHIRDVSTSAQPAGTPRVPDILSLCISWSTGLARGRASKGRIYLPVYGLNATDAGRMDITPTDQNNFITFGQALLDAFSNSAGIAPVVPVIASKLDGSIHPITGVRVGNIIDVQRRRKNALTETYVSGTWPA